MMVNRSGVEPMLELRARLREWLEASTPWRAPRSTGRKRLILHIGCQKTGTTSIQRFLLGSRKALRAEGAIYPRTGRRIPGGPRRPPAHHALAMLCQGKIADASFARRLKRVFHHEIRGYDTVIISSESFQRLRDLTLLREFFDDFADFEPQIVCYLREQLAFAVSAFLQAAQFRSSFFTFGQFADARQNVEGLVDRWSALPRVDFRPYDRDRLIEGDVVADFLHAAGLGLSPTKKFDANPSIGGNLLYARMVANKLELPFLKYLPLMTAARGRKAFRTPFHISDERAAAIRQASPHNRIVMDLVGPLALRSFAGYPRLPEAESLAEDLREIGEYGDVADTLAAIRAFDGDTSGWF